MYLHFSITPYVKFNMNLAVSSSNMRIKSPLPPSPHPPPTTTTTRITTTTSSTMQEGAMVATIHKTIMATATTSKAGGR